MSERIPSRSNANDLSNSATKIKSQSLMSKPGTSCNSSKINRTFSMPASQTFNTLIKEHESLEEDRFHLQQECLNKDTKCDDMERKLETLQTQLIDKSTENKLLACRLSQESDVEAELRNKLRSYATSAIKMNSDMKALHDYVDALRQEVCRLKHEKMEKSQKSVCKDKDDPEDAIHEIKLKRLKTQFEQLQCEYLQKQKQCEDLTERMKNCLTECDNNSREKAINEALKKRADDLLKEIDENKVFIYELQDQVEMYRAKYMKAQTKVEQQKFSLESLEKKSKILDQQVCEEIRKIKEKFQEKLGVLCSYPQKYEESKRQLDESKRKIQTLECDLKSSLGALCKAKDELERLEAKCDDELEPKYKQLLCENEMMRKRFCGLKETKKCLEDKLAEMKNELDKTRKDSAKLIEMTKTRAEQNRATLTQHISGLEIKLAQCRAESSISLAEKEETIKKLRCELAKLCSHFEFCQTQIKCMKNQIAQQSVRCVAESI